MAGRDTLGGFSGAEVTQKGVPRGWSPDADDQQAKRDQSIADLLDAYAHHAWAWDIRRTVGLKYHYIGGCLLVEGGWEQLPDLPESERFVTLADDMTNYVERDELGAVSANTAGFALDKIPMSIVETQAGTIKIRGYQDCRPMGAGDTATGGGGDPLSTGLARKVVEIEDDVPQVVLGGAGELIRNLIIPNVIAGDYVALSMPVGANQTLGYTLVAQNNGVKFVIHNPNDGDRTIFAGPYLITVYRWDGAAGGGESEIVEFLDQIGDVNAPNPNVDDGIFWDGGAWVSKPVPIGALLTGSGTPDFLTKWAGAEVIGNSAFQQTGFQLLAPTQQNPALPEYSFAGRTDQGVWSDGASSLGFAVGGVGRAVLQPSGFHPFVNQTGDLGQPGRKWGNIYVANLVADNISGGGGSVTYPLQAPNGTAGAPSYSFAGPPTKGMYAFDADSIDFSVTSARRFSISALAVTTFVPLLAPDGSGAAPSYSFANFTGTGMFVDAVGELRFATGGVGRFFIDGTEAKLNGIPLRAGNGTQELPAYSFTDFPGSGFYLFATDAPAVSAGESVKMRWTPTENVSNNSLNPWFDNTYALGSPDFAWSAGYIRKVRTAQGSQTSPGWSWEDDETTGLYYSLADLEMRFTIGGDLKYRISASLFGPDNDATVDLGTDTKRFANLWVGGIAASGFANFEANVRLTSTAPAYQWLETDAPVADEGGWRMVASGGVFYFQSRSDSLGAGDSIFNIQRIGLDATEMQTYVKIIPVTADLDLGSVGNPWNDIHYSGSLIGPSGGTSFPLLAPAGSAAAPSFAAAADPTSGLFFNATDNLAASHDGAMIWQINQTGFLAGGVAGTFDCGSTANFWRDVNAQRHIASIDGTAALPAFTFTGYLTTGMWASATGPALNFRSSGGRFSFGSGSGWEDHTSTGIDQIQFGDYAQHQAGFLLKSNADGIISHASSNAAIKSRIIFTSGSEINFSANGTTVKFTIGSGALTATVPIYGIQGTAAAPAYAFDEANTGFYRIGTNRIGMVVGGALMFDMQTSRLKMLTAQIQNTSGTEGLPSYSFTTSPTSGFSAFSSTILAFSMSGAYSFFFIGAQQLSDAGYDGIPSAPPYSFNSDRDTGMYLNAAGELGFACGSSNILMLRAGNTTDLTTTLLRINSTSEILRINSTSSSGSPYVSWHQNNTRRAYIQSHTTAGFIINQEAALPMSFYTSGVSRAKFSTGGMFHPSTSATYDLGTATLRWKDIHIGGQYRGIQNTGFTIVAAGASQVNFNSVAGGDSDTEDIAIVGGLVSDIVLVGNPWQAVNIGLLTSGAVVSATILRITCFNPNTADIGVNPADLLVSWVILRGT